LIDVLLTQLFPCFISVPSTFSIRPVRLSSILVDLKIEVASLLVLGVGSGRERGCRRSGHAYNIIAPRHTLAASGQQTCIKICGITILPPFRPVHLLRGPHRLQGGKGIGTAGSGDVVVIRGNSDGSLKPHNNHHDHHFDKSYTPLTPYFHIYLLNCLFS
jgi:hypothetical protein